MLTIHGDGRSANCLKVKWLLDYLGRDYRWVEVDVMAGGCRTPQMLALNPWGQVPVVVLEDGRALSQSGAILLYFGEGSELIPADAYDRARMLEWMFWEQYSHEPAIAVARFRVLYQGQAEGELDPELVQKGERALAHMKAALTATPFLIGDRISLADLALVAYTRAADGNGFRLARYPAVQRWIARVEAALGIG